MAVYNIIVISFSFVRGGAAMAANNFFSLINSNPAINIRKISQNEAEFFPFLKRLLSWFLIKFQFDNNPTKHSLNLFSYGPVNKALKLEKGAIFHLHWINNDTLSIWDFKNIPANSIITLHDEWMYCGAEHYYKIGDTNLDFIDGYSLYKNGVLGIHWNYLIWKIKMKQIAHRTDINYTVPSTWLYERARNSKMLKNSKIFILPNCIDTEMFSPRSLIDQNAIRKTLGLEKNDFVLTFGAIDGLKNPIKGSAALLNALKIVLESLSSIEKNKVKLLSFGGRKDDKSSYGDIPVNSLGHIGDKNLLADIYSISDIIVVPSYIESFGQVAAESLSCETPVVCFKTSGLTDIVIDGINGYISEPFSAVSLSDNILRVIRMSKQERNILGISGRKHILANFSQNVVRDKYLKIIEKACS